MFVQGSALQNWIIAIFTLALFSVAFKENPLYRFVEHLYVGMAAAYGICLTWFNYGYPVLFQRIPGGKAHYIIPVIIGLMMYTRYFKPIAWLSRFTMSFLLGVGAGFVLSTTFRSLVLLQVTATFLPLWSSQSFAQTINNLIIVCGVAGTLIYFFFTAKRKGVIGVGAQFGKWVMMVAFGTAFGNTVMARVSLFLGRMQFLLGDWLKIIN